MDLNHEQVSFLSAQSHSQWLAGRLIGTTVHNAADETLGTIEDIVIDSNGNVEGVVIGVGGFLGVGEKRVGVPYKSISIGEIVDKERRITLNATSGQLEDAPSFSSHEPSALDRFSQRASELGAAAKQKASEFANTAKEKAKQYNQRDDRDVHRSDPAERSPPLRGPVESTTPTHKADASPSTPPIGTSPSAAPATSSSTTASPKPSTPPTGASRSAAPAPSSTTTAAPKPSTPPTHVSSDKSSPKTTPTGKNPYDGDTVKPGGASSPKTRPFDKSKEKEQGDKSSSKGSKSVGSDDKGGAHRDSPASRSN